MVRTLRRHQRSRTRFYWLVPVAFLAHCAEELPRFPSWASQHFGTTTRRFYVASHCVLVPLIVASGARASARPGDPRAAFFATSVAAALGLNAVFHAGTTVLFRRYSPGLITAIAAMLPASAYAISRTRRDGLLTDEQLLGALLAGTSLGNAAIASLYVHMPRLGGEAG